MGRNLNLGQSSDIYLFSVFNKNTKGGWFSAHWLCSIIATGVNGIYSNEFSGKLSEFILPVSYLCTTDLSLVKIGICKLSTDDRIFAKGKRDHLPIPIETFILSPLCILFKVRLYYLVRECL